MNKTTKNILIVGGLIAVSVTAYLLYNKYKGKKNKGGENVRMENDTNQDDSQPNLTAESKQENTIQFTR